ncbi:MAG: DUF4145 domain-containing protein [Patescibacteria group bacterium]
MDLKNATIFIEEYVKDLIDNCPHCEARVHIEKLWGDYHSFKNGNVEFYVIFRCKPCKKLILKTYLFEQDRYSNETNLKSIGWDEKFPVSLDTELSEQDSEHIPEQVLLDYKEALKCKSINANRASCSMFRRALQSSLLELGANESVDLIEQINSLNKLPQDIKDWAHQIRIFGNWGTHPDKDNLKEINNDDVIEVYDFISKFFIYVFIMPKKVESSRKRREEKINKENQEGNQN